MNKEQARTTAEQLTGDTRNPYGLLKLMVGWGNFAYGNNALTFKFKMCSKANYMRITLNSMDLYDIEFIKVWGTKITTVKAYEGMYGDQLKETFESFTGLTLGVPRVQGINA